MKKALLLITSIMLLSTIFAQAQRKVTGNVIGSDDGMGLIGAAVTVKGTKNVAITDFDGNFLVSVPEGFNTLVITYVGMQTQEIDISNTDNINTVMKPDVTKIEEVIVAGVASATPKRKLSISVIKVDAKDLEAVPATSAATALQGKVAGITVVSSGGTPGKSASIRLRGSTSIVGSQDPLIIVDGVMMEGELADINTDDVASYEVVKGAAASALYGSRAGNGVIVITSKRGNSVAEGKTEIRVRNEYGFQNLAKEIDLATHHPYRLADDWASQKKYTKYYGVTYPANYTGGFTKDIVGSRTPDYDYLADNPYSQNINHQKELFRTGDFYTNYVSFANNSGRTKVFGSFENNANSGIIEFKSGSKRQNIRFNIDHALSDKLKFSSSTLLTENKMDESAEGDGSPFFGMLFMSPDVDLNLTSPDSLELKQYYSQPDQWSNEENPKHAMYYNKIKQSRSGVMQNISVNYKPLTWLDLNVDYSLEKQSYEGSNYIPRGYQNNNRQLITGFIVNSSSKSLSQNLQTVANLNGQFGDLVTKAKLAYLYENMQAQGFNARGSNFVARSITSLNNTTKPLASFSSEIETRAINYSAITDIDYKDRYIFSVLARYDGSSLFGSEKRWNPFYRVSGAWIVSKDIEINGVDFWKLRVSQGTSGQRPGFNFQYETYSTAGGIVSKNFLGNKNLKSAVTTETEYGFDLEFLQKFELHYVYALNTTKGAFLYVPQPAISGYRFQWQNAGNMSSVVNEITLGAKIIDNSNLKWRANFSFDKVQQKYDQINAPDFRIGPENTGTPAFYVRSNENVGVMYGIQWLTSLNQLAPSIRGNYTINSDGYVIVKGTEGTKNEKPIALDKDGDGTPDAVKIADMNPKFNLSFSNTLTYKSISCNMLWHLKYGGNIYNQTKQFVFRENRAGVQDQYSKPNNLKKAATYYQELYHFSDLNSYFVEDGTYLKLREVSVYYAINKTMLFIKEFKVGILARNILTFTKYTGWDPEVSSGGDGTNFVFDSFSYPNFRSFSMSVEFKF